jgi:hypothetical protein
MILLTRTSGRPNAFGRLRKSVESQVGAEVIHVVHSDDPRDTYVVGDLVVRGSRLRRTPESTAPWETYNLRLLSAVREAGLVGAVAFVDDDDLLFSDGIAARVDAETTPGFVTFWRVLRENGRLSPKVWMGDLGSADGRVCWESGSFHTDDIPAALSVGVDDCDGGDGRFWWGMSKVLTPRWVNEVTCFPQVGKGHGRRKDV